MKGYIIDCDYVIRVKDIMDTYTEDVLPIITVTTEMMEDVQIR